LAPAGSRAVPPREREVGTVIAVTPTGQITVRSSGRSFLSEGTPVIDRTGRDIGRVSRVFGPVDQPFLSVRPRAPLRPSEAVALVGSTVRRG
jgi:rRNA processing protein Gar1